jgi:hypothetical protein
MARALRAVPGLQSAKARWMPAFIHHRGKASGEANSKPEILNSKKN